MAFLDTRPSATRFGGTAPLDPATRPPCPVPTQECAVGSKHFCRANVLPIRKTGSGNSEDSYHVRQNFLQKWSSSRTRGRPEHTPPPESAARLSLPNQIWPSRGRPGIPTAMAWGEALCPAYRDQQLPCSSHPTPRCPYPEADPLAAVLSRGANTPGQAAQHQPPPSHGAARPPGLPPLVAGALSPSAFTRVGASTPN